jgi:hypothetical protein
MLGRDAVLLRCKLMRARASTRRASRFGRASRRFPARTHPAWSLKRRGWSIISCGRGDTFGLVGTEAGILGRRYGELRNRGRRLEGRARPQLEGDRGPVRAGKPGAAQGELLEKAAHAADRAWMSSR